MQSSLMVTVAIIAQVQFVRNTSELGDRIPQFVKKDLHNLCSLSFPANFGDSLIPVLGPDASEFMWCVLNRDEQIRPIIILLIVSTNLSLANLHEQNKD